MLGERVQAYFSDAVGAPTYFAVQRPLRTPD
jgi:hypothetical protein